MVDTIDSARPNISTVYSAAGLPTNHKAKLIAHLLKNVVRLVYVQYIIKKAHIGYVGEFIYY